MTKTIEGTLSGNGLKLCIIATRWNEFIVEKLTSGAVSAAKRHGVAEDNIEIVMVPGAYEIPFIARKLAATKRYDAIIALGCVIRGSTPHFDYVAGEAAKGIASAANDTNVPISFGVLTTDTIEQSIERAGTKAGNKGEEAAIVAIEMANLSRTIEEL